eukprot:25856-Pyramimonas_sp.AAC.1
MSTSLFLQVSLLSAWRGAGTPCYFGLHKGLLGAKRARSRCSWLLFVAGFDSRRTAVAQHAWRSVCRLS